MVDISPQFAQSKRPSASLGEKAQGATCSIIFGIILIVLAIPILVKNEGRAVQTTRSLDEGLKNVHEIEFPGPPQQEINGKLIHISGELQQLDELVDPDFGIGVTGIRLKRNVEMLQWLEDRRDSRRTDNSGREVTETTYSYRKDWTNGPINSNRFHDSSYANPDQHSWMYTSMNIEAKKVSLGNFQMSRSLINQVQHSEPIRLTSSRVKQMRKHLALGEPQNEPQNDKSVLKTDSGTLRLVGNSLQSANSTPVIGDIRVTFQSTPIITVSVIAQQKNGHLIPYSTKAGDVLEMLSYGVVDAKSMIEAAHAGNAFMTWFFRGLGCLLMFFGFRISLNLVDLLAELVEYIPLFGGVMSSLISFGVFIVAAGLSLSLSMVVIGISWIVYRPMVTSLLLIIAAIPILGIFKSTPKEGHHHKLNSNSSSKIKNYIRALAADNHEKQDVLSAENQDVLSADHHENQNMLSKDKKENQKFSN